MNIDNLKTVQVFDIVNALIRQMPGPIPRGMVTCGFSGPIYDTTLGDKLAQYSQNCVFSVWDTFEFLYNKVFVPFEELGLLDAEELTMDELNLICEFYSIFSAMNDMRDLCKSGYLKFTKDSIWLEVNYHRCLEKDFRALVADNRMFIKDSPTNFLMSHGRVEISFILPQGHKSSFVALLVALDRMLWKAIVSENHSRKVLTLKLDISNALWNLVEMLAKQECETEVSVSN